MGTPNREFQLVELYSLPLQTLYLFTLCSFIMGHPDEVDVIVAGECPLSSPLAPVLTVGCRWWSRRYDSRTVRRRPELTLCRQDVS
jgi:hypothetical protein